MPPPHLPPPERGESESAPTPGFRRHVGKLFWVGVAIAPIAALLLVLGSGVGPLRAAAVLAVFSVVIIGLSVVLRDDAAMVKDDVEDQLRTEVDRLRADIDSLRRGVEVSVHRELERVHRELEATRRDSVLRAESTRLNRLTGALPAGEDDYPLDGRYRGTDPRTPAERRAITARMEADINLPPPDPGYDWFGSTEGEDGHEGAPRQEPIRYEAGTYGSARPSEPAAQAAPTAPVGPEGPAGNWPRHPAEAEQAPGRRRRGNRYEDEAAAANAKPAGTEYGRRRAEADGADAAARYQTYQAGTYGSGTYDPDTEDTSGRRRSGRRRAAEEDPAPSYELIDYDDAPPVYTPQRLDAGVYGSRTANGAEAQRADDGSGEAGTIDYTEFWARSASPPRAEAERGADRGVDGDRSSASEWSSWRENSGGWDVGSPRYNRDDPQVITGAITGDVFDVPYTVGGQSLGESGFGAGNGFGAGTGFGAGNGFGAQRWDEVPDVPPAPGWSAGSDRAASAAADQASAEFELPSLEHLPPAGAPPAPEGSSGSGGRHARHASAEDESSRYRSW
ncbi:hypothetical protein [Cryptosporangium aurantiacum]|uniref:Uncharacterized protein n=1 Tax=Cryptosporangium aurantiacum TaxID=134849 RepID=A0A1M7NC66_9ACTN|nr:hypothetical protein [Cryptosporangium aurantiacum]SHN01120.1 hypothetical protein SAMN05443668_102533 [Cryptosporangium aurantiacum]